MKNKIELTEEQEKDFNEMREEFIENHLVYAPNSIRHGMKVYSELQSKETILRIEIARLNGFIEYLFEYSEHCDHISQTDAWDEFEKYEYAQLINENKITNGEISETNCG